MSTAISTHRSIFVEECSRILCVLTLWFVEGDLEKLRYKVRKNPKEEGGGTSYGRMRERQRHFGSKLHLLED